MMRMRMKKRDGSGLRVAEERIPGRPRRRRHGSAGSAAALLLALGFTMAAAPVRAQGGGSTADLSRPLSVDALVRLALDRSLLVAQAHEVEAAARGSRTSALSGVLPSLNATVGYTWNDNEQGAGYFNQTTGRFVNDRDSWILDLRGDVNLLSAASWYNLSSARSGVAAARYGASDREAEIVLAVRRQYYLLVAAQELARVARESYDLRQEQLRRAESLFELGSVARSDVLQAQVNLATAERERIAAENAIVRERARLAVMLALPVDAPLEVEPPAPVQDSVTVESEEELVRRAEANLPALQQARAEVAAARAGERATRAQLWPSLGLSYSYSKQEIGVAGDLAATPLKEDATWGYTVGLSAPLFDGMRVRGESQRAAAERRSRERGLDAARLDAALGVREARLAIRNAAETLRSAREGVRFAEESARLQRALYESGGGTLLEWNNAQVELTRAQVAVVQAEAELRSAQAELERAVGAPVNR